MRRFLVFGCPLLLLLAACSGRSANKSSLAAAPARTGAGVGGALSTNTDGFTSSASSASHAASAAPPVDLTKVKQDSRQLIKTGDVSLQAKDVDTALLAATKIVQRAGGDMFSGDSELADARQRHIHAVFKVAPEQFDTVMAQLASVGKILSTHTDTDDVTGQVVDLDARLAAAQTSVARLRDLLAHSGNVTDLLQVEQTLSQREGEAESLAAQSQALHAQVAQATITVDFAPTPAVAKAKPAKHTHIPGFAHGLRSGIVAFVTALLVVVTGLGYALPFLLLLALIGYPTARVLQRRKRAVAAAN